jgi:hypothetical protein
MRQINLTSPETKVISDTVTVDADLVIRGVAKLSPEYEQAL